MIPIADNKIQMNFEARLALQCAPLLTGIKVATILIINKADKERTLRIFKNSAISYYVLYESITRVSFFFYHREELLSYLHHEPVAKTMKMLGYHNDNLPEILNKFSKRYGRYMKLKELFPHEMGLLLGYPVKDVLGFINNRGENFLYIGYWKVYGDVTKALETFEKYNRAKESVMQMLSQGVSIQHIINLYHTNSKCNKMVV